MIYQNYQKHLFYTAFAAILAIGLLVMSEEIVKSQRAEDTQPSPFKFGRLPALKKDIPNITTAPTSAGSLLGKWTIDFSSIENAHAVAAQTDGKIVVAGSAIVVGNNNFRDGGFAVFRYNADGSLDTSFGGDGKVTTPISNNYYYDYANAVAVQPDGKIIAAGYGSRSGDGSGAAALVRYNPDGSLDASFGAGGKVFTDQVPPIYEIAVQPDGKIVAAGVGFTITRFNPTGALDTSFGTGGIVTTNFGNEGEYAYSVAVQADGKIVAAGDSGGNENADFALSRYNADGSLDTAFDFDGKQTTSWRVRNSAANAVVIDERPGFAPATFFVGGANGDFAIAREGGSKTITPIGNWDTAYAAAIDPSGRIIAAGSSDGDFALVRYFSNLALDTSFDGDGKVITNFYGDNDAVTAVAVQADNKIVALGSMDLYGREDLALARYNDNGSLDASFGTGGRVITPAIQNPKAMAIQPDGKILAAGYAPHTVAPFGDNFAVARFNPDGSLDTSFDGDGIAVTRFDQFSRISALALQPDGKIVAAGYTAGSNFSLFALARYNADGSLDTSFDADGKVTTSVYGVFSSASAVRLQRNGKIVAVGSVLEEFGNDFALARYNSDGSLDATFDTDGALTTDFFGRDDYAFAAAIQRDGRIIAAGSAAQNGKTDFAVAHYGGDAVQTKVPYDFDGDGLADLSVFRPSNSVWYLNRSTQGFTATQWGLSTDKITPADFDGDGKTDTSVYRDGVWYWLSSSNNYSFNARQFGVASDIPVPADYTGDGKAELAVYRGGVWYVWNLASGQFQAVQFGLSTDKPVVGDYDGDGRADYAVYRNGTWYLLQSTQGFAAIQFGVSTDKVVPSDYDGDGKTDIAVYRDGFWYLQQSSQGFAAFQFGIASDVPAPADYDGDGRTDAAVYRDGVWYLRQTANGFAAQQFGSITDQPVPAAYLP
jgi:uncharacterized delta-60 repeat protein